MEMVGRVAETEILWAERNTFEYVAYVMISSETSHQSFHQYGKKINKEHHSVGCTAEINS